MAPITIYSSTMSGITWRALTGKAVSEHLLMIEISKAGKHGLLLEKKLRQMEPIALAPAGRSGSGQGIRRIFPGANEAIGNGRMSFPGFLAMVLIEAHHPHLYRREFSFRP